MVEYICNRCGFGSDELDEAIDPRAFFDLMYEEYYCGDCMQEYESGTWKLERSAKKEFLELFAYERPHGPSVAEVMDAFTVLKRNPNDFRAQYIISQASVTER